MLESWKGEPRGPWRLRFSLQGEKQDPSRHTSTMLEADWAMLSTDPKLVRLGQEMCRPGTRCLAGGERQGSCSFYSLREEDISSIYADRHTVV